MKDKSDILYKLTLHER